MKQSVGNAKQYNQIIFKYYMKRQMPWSRDTLIAQIVPDPRQYYLQLIKSSRGDLMVVFLLFTTCSFTNITLVVRCILIIYKMNLYEVFVLLHLSIITILFKMLWILVCFILIFFFMFSKRVLIFCIKEKSYDTIPNFSAADGMNLFCF